MRRTFLTMSTGMFKDGNNYHYSEENKDSNSYITKYSIRRVSINRSLICFLYTTIHRLQTNQRLRYLLTNTTLSYNSCYSLINSNSSVNDTAVINISTLISCEDVSTVSANVIKRCINNVLDKCLDCCGGTYINAECYSKPRRSFIISILFNILN